MKHPTQKKKGCLNKGIWSIRETPQVFEASLWPEANLHDSEARISMNHQALLSLSE